MLIIAGHLLVDPTDRDAYPADCRTVVEPAREAPGCLDSVIAADAGRIGVYERWETEAELDAFRGSGPGSGTAARILDSDVRRDAIASVGPA